MSLVDEKKVEIAGAFVQEAPPGEFLEVVTALRSLVANDTIINERLIPAFAKYNKDQLAPVRAGEQATMLSEWAELPPTIASQLGLPNPLYYSPRLKRAFRFDHLRHEASDWRPLGKEILFPVLGLSDTAERYRAALEDAATHYLTQHYRGGVCEVYARPSNHAGYSLMLVICIENHMFQSRNYWNGNWRSQWTVYLSPEKPDTKPRLEGKVRVLVHYFEEGNTQLNTNKEHSATLAPTADEKAFATSVIKAITTVESNYQTAVNETFSAMSDTTFKALRRPLPVTRSKIEWVKIVSYKIGAELRGLASSTSGEPKSS